jgi:hypothetical protein
VNAFLEKHSKLVIGQLSGFDRLVIRGKLRALSYVEGLRGFLNAAGILLRDFGRYAEKATEALKAGSLLAARKEGRPVQYLDSPSVRKDQLAREIAARDGVREGLICVLSAVEPCWGFDINRNRETQHLELVRRKRKCLHFYHYLLHPTFGFMHVRLQTWLPFDIQIWMNGREWLARDLDRSGIGYVRRGNTFSWLEDVERAQQLLTSQLQTNWPKRLDDLAAEIHPAHPELFPKPATPDYYWSVYQSEWATDTMFRDPESLARVYPRLIQHGMSHFGSSDVMRFLGRKLNADASIPARFQGEVMTDLRRRPEGVRIKHHVAWNSIKLYDKEGTVLRVETTINRPQDFKVFRPREGDPGGEKAWRPMRQGIADIHRRAEVSDAANERYLAALAAIESTQPLGELLSTLAQPTALNGRRVRALNPASKADLELLAAVNRGEFAIRGFRNADLRVLLYSNEATEPREARRRSARITRLIRLLRGHGLVTKVQKTNRYMLTLAGRRAITAVLAARDASIQKLVGAAA